MATGKPKTSAPNIVEVTVLTVSDLHQSRKLYEELTKAVALHKPDVVAVVGDCLHAGEDFKDRLTVQQCAATISALPAEVVFARGNHEDENWVEFAKHWRCTKRPLVALNGEAFKTGPLVIVAFPCMLGDESHFLEGRDPLPYDTEEWLLPLLRLHGAPARTLWLIHEPPKGTPLSQAGSVVEGQQEWTDAIERFNPMLVVSGHDHITPQKTKRWHCKIKNSTCVNIGQSDHGPLHFTLVKAKFASASPCLPSAVEVTAFPANETICIP
jgi:Icc-related predicted phosphoesterase